MAGVLTLDWETTTKTLHKRKASPFCPENKIVIHGLKYDGQDTHALYLKELPDGWLDNVKIIVAHNAGFDLLWIWGRKDFRAWLKAGGKIWCTQYAEYLLTGQQAMWNSLDDCAAKYGGELKNDEIKAMWEAGIDTLDIPKDMLIDYAIGDVDNTYLIFKEQLKIAREKGMINTLHTHMEALLCLIEMEYNGLYIDSNKAEELREKLEKNLAELIANIAKYIPKAIPKELTWNWGSSQQLSALLFGGKIKYRKKLPILDDFGNKTYTKKTESWYLVNKEPIHPDKVTEGMVLDTYKTGKKAGTIKTCKVPIQGDLKERYEDLYFELDGITTPDSEWATKTEGVYSTGEDILVKLYARDIELVKDLLKWRKLDKDLGSFYKRYDPKKKTDVGMLTLIHEDGRLHHTLNNIATITGRLSCSSPNLQQIPRKSNSEIKKVFISRWKDKGLVAEADFSQLEVIIQGLLSGDKNLVADIVAGVDFHVKRAAKKLGMEYDELFKLAKIDHVDEYVNIRQNSKEFSFQKAYGAGAYAIAASTGMSLDDVKAFIKAEDEMYSGVVTFNNKVMCSIKRSAKPTGEQLFTDGRAFIRHAGEIISPTGKRYTFKEEVAPEFMRKPRDKRRQPIYTSFSPTQAKNYVVQGCAGEIVLLCAGKLFREFLARDNFDGKALLVNSVHDCFWLDAHESVAVEATKLVHTILESADKLIEERYNIPCPVVFRVESEIGRNMYDLVDIDHFNSDNLNNRRD